MINEAKLHFKKVRFNRDKQLVSVAIFLRKEIVQECDRGENTTDNKLDRLMTQTFGRTRYGMKPNKKKSSIL